MASELSWLNGSRSCCGFVGGLAVPSFLDLASLAAAAKEESEHVLFVRSRASLNLVWKVSSLYLIAESL
jgi:hypothetical protein